MFTQLNGGFEATGAVSAFDGRLSHVLRRFQFDLLFFVKIVVVRAKIWIRILRDTGHVVPLLDVFSQGGGGLQHYEAGRTPEHVRRRFHCRVVQPFFD